MISFEEWKIQDSSKKGQYMGSTEPGRCRDCGVPTFSEDVLYCEKCLDARVEAAEAYKTSGLRFRIDADIDG